MGPPVFERDGRGVPRLDRRQFVYLLTGAVVGTAGCGSGSETPEPVGLSGGKNCDQCGMVIEQHPGPVGQTYYEADRPEGRDGPAWFCSSVCAYRYRFDAIDRDWTPVVTYLTDYSGVDYTVQSGDRQFISAHLDKESFERTANLEVVIDSGVEGAMGPALIPFGDGGDARSFAEAHGGDVIDATDVSRVLLDEL
jgi:nitrous oxide reductase accessory protein NosL